MINHHPPSDLLLDYATGSLPEPAALVVASHAAMCPQCRSEIAATEAVGGALLDRIEPIQVSDVALAAVMARLDGAGAKSALSNVTSPRRRRTEHCGDATPVGACAGELMPQPLRRYAGEDLSRLAWRKVGKMFEEAKLPIEMTGFKASLMRLPAGSTIPIHTHGGREYTLVLAGGFRDNGVRFERGDFAFKDASDTHRPVVDPEGDCLCLAVLDAPVRLTGMIGRLINPFLRM